MKWKLIILPGTQPATEFPITRAPLSIGRSKECNIVVTHGGVSRRHCQVVLIDRVPFVVDNESRNGVYVNGERVAGKRQLRAGDCLKVGPAVYCVGVSAGCPSEEAEAIDEDATASTRAVVA